jgi:tetratricopeptide (TPR) repeat protein
VIRSEPERATATATTKAAPSTASASRSPAVAPASNTTASAKSAPARKEGRSVLESVNPLNLFRREPKPAARVTPLPEKDAVAPSVVVVKPDVGGSPTTTTASRPASGFARYEFRSSINVTPGDRAAAEALLAQGNAAMTSKNYGEATKAYQGAAQADPSWYQAYFNQSAAALEAGRTVEALNASETAVALKPDSADARYNFALALRRGNFVPDAAAQLEKLLVANPDDVRAHLTLGNIYAEQLRLNDKARVHYQRVLKLAPRHPQAQAIRYWLASNPK